MTSQHSVKSCAFCLLCLASGFRRNRFRYLSGRKSEMREIEARQFEDNDNFGFRMDNDGSLLRNQKELWSPASTSSSSSGALSSIPVFSDAVERVTPPKIRDICPQICVICGDPATGYHYSVGSCNGCKTFFRRSVIAEKVYVCKRDGTCAEAEDSKARRKCRKCRFDKCIEAGMNPLGIQTKSNPGENAVVRDILCKRRLELVPQEASTSQPKVHAPLTLVEDTMDRLIDGLMYLELASDRFRRSKYNPKPHEPCSLELLLDGPSKMGIDFGDMEGWPLPPRSPPPNWMPFEEHIEKRIPLPMPPDKCHKGNGKMWPLVNLICSIEYVKTFGFFHQLDFADKVVLLKHVSLMAAHLTSAFYSFSQKSDHTVSPDGGSPPFIDTQRAHNSKFFYATHKAIISSFIRLQPDRKEYVMLKALIVCSDSIDDLSDGARAILGEEKRRYNSSLFSYTLASRGPVHGPTTYAEIISLVDHVTRIAKIDKDTHVLMFALGLMRQGCRLLDQIYDA